MKKITLSLVSGMLLAGSANLSAQNWVNGGNTLGSSGRIGTNNAQTVIFETGNNEQGRVTPGGSWGFGTIVPNARVHVNSLGSQDAFRVQNNGSTRLLINNAGNLGIGTNTPSTRFHVNRSDGNNRLGLFSNSATSGDRTALIEMRNGNNLTWRYGVGGAGNSLGLTTGQFYIERIGLGAASLTISPFGRVGINTPDPSEYMLKVKQQDAFGINLESPTGNNWEQWVASNGDMFLWANGNIKGAFRVASGEYSTLSDERAKTDIQPVSSILDKINQLKPATYHFKTDGSETARADTPLEYGFIAQDVEKVFPSLVSHHIVPERNVDMYTLNYSGFGAIAIKGIQELQQTVQDQRREISSLEARLATLETALKAITFNKLVNDQLLDKKTNGVMLEQNHPNNFNQSTTIRYTIPGDANAFILLFDNEGNLVKSVKAPATGQVELNAGGLKTGIYIYTLMVNGEPAASKRLMVAK
ncbi:MAG: hypothetical protein AVDCRST_MAG56-3502 [uncultured Cytophagales bacterium]|uniref:Peptidase S74 domain-containing protein n=1 Tax=uncultured Cytophagales bacterium TaxID=158755 RepID=A0A6J4JFQ5_9SPHI|nr:MAG: hypothetical protein AVDCRST_MAG56-3502 [uncultured Cytophagales bacterium]